MIDPDNNKKTESVVPELEKHRPEEKYNPADRQKSGIILRLWIWTKDIVSAFIIVLVLYTYVFQFSQINGNSMYPTLKNGERVLVEKVSGWPSEFERGDIITLRYPKDINKNYVKRIIAFENDTVTIREGIVYVNGEKIDEPYIKNVEPYETLPPVTVPEGYLFVMGDNRPASYDSRRWGFLPKGYAYGRVIFIIWPPRSMGAVD